ncbi:MAG: MptD family putative ECF transporter S component [Treponema sp.]|jgi:energy-coupling factor transport system substrate-specific component|nr:MptD family putative ECF transporter S component [Treponema sp.]
MSAIDTSAYQKQKGLSVKNLVTTGIFSAIYFVVFMAGGIIFAPNPVLTFYMPLGTALVCGPVYLLLVAKVPKHGPVVILGIILGLIFFATGMHWMMNTAFMALGIAADLIAGTRKFMSVRMNILSYVIFALSPVGSYLVFFLDKNGWAGTMLGKGTEQSYIDTMIASGPGWLLPVIVIGTVLAAFISGLIGRALLKKQFEKAGITA